MVMKIVNFVKAFTDYVFEHREVYDVDGNIQRNIVDQFSAEPFNLNDSGFVMSDITALMNAQTEQLVELIKSRLVELPEIYDSRDVDEIISTLKPRACQDITEITNFNNYLGNLIIDKMQAKAAKEQELKFNEAPSETAPSPAA